MRKFAIPLLLAALFAAMLSAPALAEPNDAAALMPYGTASPRDWDNLAPDGELLGSAVKADSAVLMDARTGQILFDKDGETQRYPASTTKIMTCLVALDSKKDLSSIVTVAGNLPSLPSDASKIGLVKDEQLRLEDLLYGLMLESGNDAANAIASYIGDGSIDNFVAMMNQKAQELGMTGTHYTNTNGLHENDHYTTAKDMAILARAAQGYPEFVKIVSTANYTMAGTNIHTEPTNWKNTNRLISKDKNDPYGYQYATGIKTGYTNEAGQCLVSSAQDGDMSLIAVGLHAAGQEDKWSDAITMFDYGFTHYGTIDLVQLLGTQTVTGTIKNAAASDEGNGQLQMAQLPKTKNAFITDKKDVIDQLKGDSSKFTQTVNLTKDTAPIKKDDVVGTVSYSYNGETVLECDLIANRDVAEMPTAAPSASAQKSKTPGATKAGNAPGESQSPAANGSGAGSALLWAGIVILLLLLALIAIRIVNMSRRNSKYRQYNYRQGGNTRLRR